MIIGQTSTPPEAPTPPPTGVTWGIPSEVPTIALIVLLWREANLINKALESHLIRINEILAKLAAGLDSLLNQHRDKRD